MAKKEKKKESKFSIVVSCVVAFILGAVICFGVLTYYGGGHREKKQTNSEANQSNQENQENQEQNHDHEQDPIIVEGELQIHFLELGNAYTGDCTYIKAGETDILIDAGSKSTSISTITAYLDNYVLDNKLEYVIVTHAHEDHYAGFSILNGSIFDKYECETIIGFSQTNQTDKGSSNLYGKYLLELNDEINNGATYYTAEQCVNEGKTDFDLGSGINMKILDQKYYHEKTSGENNHSVCTLFTYGSHNYLFTGDLEEKGEKSLYTLNELPKVDLYKAGHHGSKTSSSKGLMERIQPDIICVCCCCGSSEYTDVNENQFPTQEFIDNVAPYTDRVYVTTLCVDFKQKTFTSMNGNIVVSTTNEGITVNCSNDNRVLKEWAWFKENRVCPQEWTN